MSFALGVEGGRRVSMERWRHRIARCGATVEFHAQFRFEVHTGLVPVAITLVKPTLFPGAARYAAAGARSAGFELGVWSLGPTASPEEREARRQHYEAMLCDPRAAGPGSLPRLMLESLDQDKQQSLSFTTSAGRSGADYLAQVLCAAAYALEAGARLEKVREPGDLIRGDRRSGSDPSAKLFRRQISGEVRLAAEQRDQLIQSRRGDDLFLSNPCLEAHGELIPHQACKCKTCRILPDRLPDSRAKRSGQQWCRGPC